MILFFVYFFGLSLNKEVYSPNEVLDYLNQKIDKPQIFDYIKNNVSIILSDFYAFYDYDPQTSTLKPEQEPWKKVSPVIDGNTLMPSFSLFDMVFAMGEFEPNDTLMENPIYCHTFEYDGQNIIYTGYQANIPEDEDE